MRLRRGDWGDGCCAMEVSHLFSPGWVPCMVFVDVKSGADRLQLPTVTPFLVLDLSRRRRLCEPALLCTGSTDSQD